MTRSTLNEPLSTNFSFKPCLSWERPSKHQPLSRPHGLHMLSLQVFLTLQSLWFVGFVVTLESVFSSCHMALLAYFLLSRSTWKKNSSHVSSGVAVEKKKKYGLNYFKTHIYEPLVFFHRIRGPRNLHRKPTILVSHQHHNALQIMFQKLIFFYTFVGKSTVVHCRVRMSELRLLVRLRFLWSRVSLDTGWF